MIDSCKKNFKYMSMSGKQNALRIGENVIEKSD